MPGFERTREHGPRGMHEQRTNKRCPLCLKVRSWKQQCRHRLTICRPGPWQPAAQTTDQQDLRGSLPKRLSECRSTGQENNQRRGVAALEVKMEQENCSFMPGTVFISPVAGRSRFPNSIRARCMSRTHARTQFDPRGWSKRLPR